MENDLTDLRLLIFYSFVCVLMDCWILVCDFGV